MVTFNQIGENKIHPEAGITIATLPPDQGSGTVATLPTDLDLEAGQPLGAEVEMTPFQQQLWEASNPTVAGMSDNGDEHNPSLDSGLGQVPCSRAHTGIKSHGMPGAGQRKSLMISEDHQAEIEAPEYMRNDDVRKTMARRTSIVSTLKSTLETVCTTSSILECSSLS